MSDVRSIVAILTRVTMCNMMTTGQRHPILIVCCTIREGLCGYFSKGTPKGGTSALRTPIQLPSRLLGMAAWFRGNRFTQSQGKVKIRTNLSGSPTCRVPQSVSPKLLAGPTWASLELARSRLGQGSLPEGFLTLTGNWGSPYLEPISNVAEHTSYIAGASHHTSEEPRTS